jgi:hypothetical protein
MNWPDVEGGMKAYLMGKGLRAYLGVPAGADKNPSLWPLISITRVGGGQDSSEAPLDLALIQFDVWGSVGGRVACWGYTAQLRTALDAINGATLLQGQTVAYGADVMSVAFFPDPANDRPRYVVTAQVTSLVLT